MILALAPRRAVVLAAALLSACAAAGAPDSAGGPQLHGAPPITGAYGAFLAGRFAAAEGDTTAAADRLLAALRADPENPELRNRAFLAALLDGRSEATRLARLLPENPAANLLLAGGDAQAGRWERAEQRVRALNRLGVVQLLQPVLLAWVQLGRGQADAALAGLKPLAEGTRLRALNALHAALIADVAGRPRDAQRYARLAVGEQAATPWRVAALAAGIHARAGQVAEGEALLDGLAQSGDESALAVIGPARRVLLTERQVASPTEGMAEAYVALAGALRAQDQGEFALVLTQLALRLRPGLAPALLLGAEALAGVKQEEPALRLLDAVPATDPLAPVAALRRATLLDRLDRTPAAVSELELLAVAYPRSQQPPAQLGDLLRRRDRFAEAAKAYDQALERVPAPGNADWPLFYARGIARDRAGDWPRAEADLLHALSLAPEQPYVLNYLGYSWAEQGRNLDRAKAMLLRATELRPQDGNIADSLGWVLFRLGDPEALRWLERAVELEPRSSVINDHLGDAYWAAGRQREAQFQWRRALALDPEPPDLLKLEAKLRDGLPPPVANTAQRTE